MKRLAAVVVVGVVLVAGLVCAVLRYTGTVDGAPMVGLTVALIGFGAVGAIVLGVFHAYHLEEEETEDAERRKRLRRRRAAH